MAAEFALADLDRNELESRHDRGEKRLEPAISSLPREPLEGLGLRGWGGDGPKHFALTVPRQTAKVVVPFQVLFTTVFTWRCRWRASRQDHAVGDGAHHAGAGDQSARHHGLPAW